MSTLGGVLKECSTAMKRCSIILATINSTFHSTSIYFISVCDHNYIIIDPFCAASSESRGRNCTKAIKHSQRNPPYRYHAVRSTMENESDDALITFVTCPSDRRKNRASVLRSKRLATSAVCKSSSHSTDNQLETQKASIQTSRATCNVEDRKTSRKLRNRASALASRNKRTEEIDALTLKLGEWIQQSKCSCQDASVTTYLNHNPQPHRSND